MTQGELKAREQRFNSEQVNWEADKQRRERVITKYEHRIADLEPKLKALTSLIGEKTDELEQLLVRDREIRGQSEVATTALTVAAADLGVAQRSLADLNEIIARRRQELESGLVEWLADRRQGYEQELTGIKQQLAEAQTALAGVQQDLRLKQAELDDLREETIRVRSDQQTTLREGEQALAQLQTRRTPLEGEIQTLEAEVTAKRRILETTLADTRKAQAQHENFIDYEKRARKLLDTKDRELQDKAQELAEEAQFSNAKRSYLHDL